MGPCNLFADDDNPDDENYDNHDDTDDDNDEDDDEKVLLPNGQTQSRSGHHPLFHNEDKNLLMVNSKDCFWAFAHTEGK